MILGKIIGKISTMNFKFSVKGNAKKFQYVQVPFKDNYVLGQIVEIEKDLDKTIAFCNLLGYREDDKLKHLRYPLEPNTEVLVASEDFIKQTLDLKEDKNSAFLGKLDGYENISIYLDLNKLLTTHISILAKSGSGKSYSSSVIIEEILEKDIPLLIIDPHGEYSSLKYNSKNKEKLNQFGLKPKNYKNKIMEYSSNIEDNPECIPLKLNKNNISASELMHLLPARLSNSQQAMLYSVLQNINKIDFNQLILELELEENNLKYTLINILKYLEKLNLFSDAPTSLQELIQPGKCSIINLKGVSLELQQVVVYKLMKDLFEARKKSNVPPFFVVIEESHNFLPERTFGEAKSSEILRKCASVDYKENVMLKKGHKVNIMTVGDFYNLFNHKKSTTSKDGYEIINISKEGYSTPAFNEDFKIKFRPIKKVIRHLINEELYEVILEKGKKVRVTKSHSLFKFGENGEIITTETYKLKKGDYVLVPLKLPILNKKNHNIKFLINQNLRRYKLAKNIKVSSSLLRLIGYYVSEGHTGPTRIGFTFNKNEKVYIKDVIKCIKEVFNINANLSYYNNKAEILVHKTSIKDLFLEIGCGKGSKNKDIPDFIFTLSKSLKENFIRALFNGDGYLRTRRLKDGVHLEVSYKTISEKLIKKLSYLLLSLEIHHSIYYINGEKQKNLAYQIVIHDKSNCDKILRILSDNKHLNKFKSDFKLKCKNTFSLVELIPTKPFKRLYDIAKPIASDNTINERMVIKRIRANRNDLLKFLKYIKNKSRIKPDKVHLRYLSLLCKGEIGFLKIKSIKKVKPTSGYVYDLSIGENENFISGIGGIILHNSEGRKFGLGLCAISQRPSRIDKTVLSQITTQIILKVTNPYDIKAIANSVENITSETEKEIKNIPIGTAIVTGVVDLPLFVNIRPRRTKHGGEAVDMLQISKQVDISKEIKDFKDKELLLVVKQKISVEDKKIMGEDVKINLVPCLYINCNEFNLLFNLNNGELIEDFESGKGKKVFLKLDLSPQQRRVFDVALSLKEFKAANLFAKSGVQFSEVYDIINILVSKNYFVKISDKFKINPDLNLDFSKFIIYDKPDYFRLDYEKKLDKKFNSEEIKKFLENFIKIKNSKECWLEVYY